MWTTLHGNITALKNDAYSEWIIQNQQAMCYMAAPEAFQTADILICLEKKYK